MSSDPLPGTGPITERDATALLRRMLEIPSPSYGEAPLARFLVAAMTRLGFSAHADGTGNAVGELDRGAGPTVLLLGHADTAGGSLPVRLGDGRLYGRGAVDAKGALAAMICAAAAAAATGLRGRVVVVGAVEEETPLSRGAAAIRRAFEPPDALIIGEPSGWSAVVLGYKGKLDLHCEAECAPAHPSSPAPRAAEIVAGAWASLLDLLGPDASHLAFGRPGATLSSISGDLTRAAADFDVRIPPGFDSRALVAALRAKVTGADLTVVNLVPACRTDLRSPVVRALRAGIRSQGGCPAAKLKTATSDMNTLAELWDVPMASYGPGDSKLDHTEDEHIVLADYHRSIAVLRHALTELSGSRR